MYALRSAIAGLALAACALPAAAGAQPVPAVLLQPAAVTPHALGAAMLAVARAGQRLVAVGERGTVLYSDDAGANWRQAKVPVQTSLTALHFVDERTGWAVGHLGVILRSDDGGAAWTRQLDGVRAAQLVLQAARASGDEAAIKRAQALVDEGPDKAFFDVDFADRQHGIAVGAYNQAFATSDGGASWRPLQQQLPNPKGLHLYGVRLLGSQVFVAGEQGLLLRSLDGGASFETLASPYKGSFFGLLAARTGTLIAYGLRGNAWRSDDHGTHWARIELGVPVSLSAGIERPDGALLLLSQTGDLLTSRDDGRSFKRQAATEPVPATGAAAARDGSLVIASLRGLRRQSLP